MYRLCGDVPPDVHVPMETGVDMFRGRVAYERLWDPTHLRCDLFSTISSLFGFLGVYLGAGRISHFQGSRGGNDTRLHCLGTVELSGFVRAICTLLFILFWFFLYIGMGMGDTRYNYFLATGAVAVWVWLRAKPWDAELFSV